ncbi:PREDICTED: protein SPACA7 isoform X1 [Chinchilla lanigera]|uniref:protein SPACA7 isoform X1 n=1 Tax=Chinchilla lanigera TaxID=34839 RepID=UPI000695AD9C|nr:PREDICTED: protein SPACA7 isoform X1 [Chinchilla lanigera]
MAANRGTGTLFLLFLLSCWPETKLQLTKTTSVTSTTTGESLSSKAQDMHGVLDEILVQEILERNKSKLPELPDLPELHTTAVGALLEKILTNKTNTEDIPHRMVPESSHEPQLPSGENNSKNDKYEKPSILGKILQNIGRFPETASSTRED